VAGMPDAVVTSWRFDAGGLVPGLDGCGVAADVFLPPPGIAARPLAFCCLAGGGMTRAYWDLRVAGDDTYSFARWVARRGFPVITVDHLGVGDSTLRDGASAPLVGDVIAAEDAVFRLVCDELRKGGLGAEPIPRLRTAGVGHSMGAVLLVREQAVYRTHRALALLGFSTKGLPDHLSPEVLAQADREIDDHRLSKLALLMFGSPYAPLDSSNGADSPTRRAMKAAATVTFTAGGLLSMLPGNVSDELARLTVPVLILNGDRDRLISGRRTDAAQCPVGSVSRVLPGSGHNHNIADSRHDFWAQILDWAQNVVGA